jgi:hypothetical protein
MTEDRVKELATGFVFELMGRDLRLIGIHRDVRQADEWNAVFERTTQDGYVIDGPMVVIVNDRTGDVSLYE